MAAAPATRQSTLPTPLTRLVGRAREIDALRGMLLQPHVHLLTLTGPGGVGKTRLALAAGVAVAEQFADGAFFVSLAPITDPTLVLPSIAQTVGVRAAASRPVGEALADWIGDQSVLLLLDNVEQVVAAAPEVAALLAACPQLTILATSRAPLRVHAEHEYPVAPLAVPAVGRQATLAELGSAGAVQLFVQRARMVKPDFNLTAENAPVIVEICARLDGLPLAIELAAARLKVLSPQALLARLSDRLRLLTGGPRDAPARQQTLRDTIAWSYALLAPDDQRLFRQLGVFVGGWTLEAAAAVADSDPSWDSGQALDVFERLATLVEQSLVRPVEQPDPFAALRASSEPRYTMLETIREYAWEQLAHEEEADATLQRHLRYYLRWVEPAWAAFMGADQAAWLMRLDAELDNLRAAFGTALEAGDGVSALQLVIPLAGHAHFRHRWVEGQRLVEQALAVGGDVPTDLLALGVGWLGTFAKLMDDHAAASAALERSLALFRQVGDRPGEADILVDLGMVFLRQGRYERAGELFEEAVRVARSTDDRFILARALHGQFANMGLLRQYTLARPIGEESLSIFRALGNHGLIITSLIVHGFHALWQRDLERAARLGEEALATAREAGDIDAGWAQQLLGDVDLDRGRYREAGRLYRASLGLREPESEGSDIAEILEGLAGVAAGLGDAQRAATLLGAAEVVRERFATPQFPPRQERYDRTVAAVREALAPDLLAAAWEAGRRLSNTAAVQYALEPEQIPARVGGPAPPGVLSLRELEVLRLLAAGRSDREIAAALFISYRTVTTHVTSILNKLGLDSRTAAAIYAVRQGLV